MADIYVSTTGNDTTGTGAVGTPYASPGKAASVMVAGDRLFLKNDGVYVVSVNTNNVAGGKPVFPAGTVTNPTRVIGYTTNATPTNTDAKPVIRCDTGVTGTLVSPAGNYVELYNLDLDGNGKTIVLTADSAGWFRNTRCDFHGVASGNVVNLSANSATLFGRFYSNTSSAAVRLAGLVFGCVMHDNVGISLFVSGQAAVVNCLLYGNTNAASTEGVIYLGAGNLSLVNVTIRGSTGNDLFINSGWCTLINVVATNATLYGMTGAAGASGPYNRILNGAGYSNGTANYNPAAFPVVENFVAASADPFTNAAGGDFSLNDAASGGALLRGAGVPGAFPGGLTSSYVDIGASHHESPSAASVAAAVWTRPDRTLTS